MKTPPPTPCYDQLLSGPTDRFQRVWQQSLDIDDSTYPHWEELRHREPPPGLSVEEWWYAHQMRRRSSATEFPELRARNGEPLRLSSHPRIDAARTKADQRLAGSIAVPEAIGVDAESRDRFLVSSLMEEAIHSSLYEGAVSTREAAKDLLRSGRGPATLDERMILNNYRAMERIRELKNEAMSLPCSSNCTGSSPTARWTTQAPPGASNGRANHGWRCTATCTIARCTRRHLPSSFPSGWRG